MNFFIWNRTMAKSVLKEARLLTDQKELITTRPPIPDLEIIKSALKHSSTVDWVVKNWEMLIDFELFYTLEEKSEIAKSLLAGLSEEFPKCLHKDLTVEFRTGNLALAVGINVFDWTLFASGADTETKFVVTSSDDLDLLQIEK